MTEAILATKKWMMDSGIQNLTGNNYGGFNSWFDFETKQYPYIYSEITGYGITSLLFLDKFFEGDFVDRARAAADWIIDNELHGCGGVKTRDYQHEMDESEVYSFESGNIFAFDNGMVLYGIINLYKKTGDEKYLGLSKKIADFMINTLRKDDGLFYAIFNPNTGEKEDYPKKWSSQSGSYHAKLSMGFTDIYDVTGEDKYKNAAIKLCEASLKFQDSSGRFITSRDDNSTHLHPHAYSAEGLLYTGIYFGREDFIESAEKAITWALSNQSEDGGIPKKYVGDSFVKLYRTDILAQILRLAVVLCELKKLDEKYEPNLKVLRGKLLEFQYSGNDPQDGGFYYGFTLDGERKKHINSWCSMFAVQALIMFEEVCLNDRSTNKMECFV